MSELSRYLFEALRKDQEFVLYRGRSKDDASQILVLSPVAVNPRPVSLKRLEHEYSLRETMDPAWSARPIAMAYHSDRLVLVLEDPGGVPLNRLLSDQLDLARSLRLAIGLSTVIERSHQRGIIHKDIKPANVLVNSDTGQCWLTGFGIASQLPRERQSADAPEFLAGTLAYMAPEQTGRMNRSIDSRSDLYALGVTLYEMLTGSLPFTASDPMEWVHCHMARQPVPPDARLKNIPGSVSAIIMKLLAKTAEERYQTAAGAESDLRRCLAEWEIRRRIDEFPLGEHDTPDRLLIPEKLYGRAREIDTLLAAFQRVVASGRPELVLVLGYSGIGKSSVVHELHKVLVPPRGLFASGKFDQYKRDIPYSTLAQAFQGLIRPLLGKSDAELGYWRDALREAVGSNGRLIVDLVPELARILGEQPPIPELPPQDAQRRFQLVFRRFIGVFARPEHPLALFLDDLQWLDAATLDLLEDLLTSDFADRSSSDPVEQKLRRTSRSDVQHLMLIGAYRDNEVSPAHPLMRKLEAIRKAGAIVHEIRLAPLAPGDVERLIADALHCEPAHSAPLAQLVHEKTAGNPFFLIQFLYALAGEGLLIFNHEAARWTWDLNRIHAKSYTDNVVDLMVGKLNHLPAETQKALQQLACLGNIAEIRTLSIVLGTSEAALNLDLSEAVRQELVERLAGSYKFVHDRVQEAAYSLTPEVLRAEAHLQIGRLLAAHTPAEKREEAAFAIVNQLNRAAPLITSQDEREHLAELNLTAGKRAKASTAYASALEYLVAGCALLPEDSWEQRYLLTFALEFQRAECEFLTGDFAAAEERLSMLSGRVRDLVDSAAVTHLRAELYTTLDRTDRAVEVGLEYLRRIGVNWSPHPTKDELRQEYEQIWRQLASRPIEGLVDLPPMTDPACRATLDVLAVLEEPAHFTDENLRCLAVARMVNLSLKYGNSDGSCVAYVDLGWFVIPRFGDYRPAFRFGKLGLDLVEKRGLERFRTRVFQCFGYFINPWSRHLRSSVELLRRSFTTARETGDLKYAVYACDRLVTLLLAVGDPLSDVQREAESGLEFACKGKFGYVVDVIAGQLALIRTLRGLTSSLSSFNDAEFDEGRFERHLEVDPNPVFGRCWYWIRKLQARYLAGDYVSAVAAASNAEPLVQMRPYAEIELRGSSTSSRAIGRPGVFESVEYLFYDALARAALSDPASLEERAQNKETIAAHQEEFEAWAQNCPENFAHRAALLAAEIARLESRDSDAARLYEDAIRLAGANGFVHNEALANELAGRFYAARGFETIAQAYMRNAWHCYLRWGAAGKVRQLEELYPHLREEAPAPSGSTIEAPVEHLDLATVIKVSQAVSVEIVFEKLIQTLMRTAVEHAGAERGLLILQQGSEPRIEAEATISDETILVNLRDVSVAETAVPESIVHYVARTQESVILDDASAENSFSADPYIRRHHARSILCIPLINQAKLIGLLYLENSLTPHVFTPTRLSVLKLLASQAAISLENTRLYRDLEEREARIRRLVDANIIGIYIGNVQGEIIEANEAFLHMVGYSREDLIWGRVRWDDLSPPEWRDRTEQARAELKATGTVPPYEKEFFRKDGSRVPVLIGAAVFEASGNEGVAFVLDLSEQKHAERALRRSEAYLSEAQRLSRTGSFGWNVFSGKIYWSQETFRIFEYDLATEPTLELVLHRTHPEDRALVRQVVDRVLQERKDFEVEHRLLMADDSVKYLRVVGRPSKEHESGDFEFVGAVTDITELKRAEEVLRQKEVSLRETQTELAHVCRVTTMGELAASIAHEVNQPLAGMVTNANASLRWLAGNSPNLSEAREAIRRIIRDGARASDVISRMRALFKKASTAKDRLDINEAIEEVVILTQSEARRNKVALRTELATDLPPVMGDRVQLQQVVLNLILNAIEAMGTVEDRERDLVIRTQRGEGDEIRVAVRDSGIGFDPLSAERIFDAFHTTKPGGLGMGLSISRSIVENHGGRLWATSNDDPGATFQFTLLRCQ